MSDERLEIVVTGAASGIGRAVVERLVDTGQQVVAVDRRDCPVPGVRTVPCDLEDEASLQAAVHELPLHVAGLANVAGVPGTLDAATVLSVNLLAPRRLTTLLLPRLVPGAAVVNVSSVAAHRCTLTPDELDALRAVQDAAGLDRWLSGRAIAGPAAYDTSKRALNDWTRALAATLVPSGRRALTVSPGPIETPILSDFRTSMGVDAIARAEQTVGRHGRADEVAAVVCFALSPEASWLNGIDIPVEGGLGAVRAAASTPVPEPAQGASA